MIWFGPAGIDSTYTTERYRVQHQGPCRAGLDDIVLRRDWAKTVPWTMALRPAAGMSLIGAGVDSWDRNSTIYRWAGGIWRMRSCDVPDVQPAAGIDSHECFLLRTSHTSLLTYVKIDV